jgi:stalled ribosome rescue protein Dom34
MKPFTMTTTKNKKQYGVWMDTQVARIAGRKDIDSGGFVMLGEISNDSSNQAATLSTKFFKEIANKMPNVDELHITGTGQVQEQFMKFLADTPQYKNAVTSESTSNKMGDEQLLSFFTNYFN